MDFEETVVLCELMRFRRKRKRKEYWVHPLWSDRLLRGKFYTMYHKLREHPKKFFRYFRMSVRSYDELLRTLGPALIYENTNLRLSVPAEERLAVTLRTQKMDIKDESSLDSDYSDTNKKTNSKLKNAKKPNTIYHCEHCPEQFLTKRAVVLHSRAHLKLKGVTFTCALCQETFKTNDELIEHKYVHDSGDLCFTCNKCEVAFSNHRDYLYHRLRHTKATVFKCEECSYTYQVRKSFKEHIATHYDRKLKCQLCGATFKQSKDLQTHRRNFHKTGIQCVECGKNNQTRRDYEEHMVSHTGVKVFQCLYCGKGFSRSALRRVHARKHTKSKPYECEVCLQKFDVKNSLSLHMITHNPEKRYECHDCGKQYFHRNSIIHHTRKHMNHGLYKCPKCKRSYPTYQYLCEHTEVAHIKKRPFKCDACDVTFVLKRALQKHMKTRYHRNNAYAMTVNETKD